MKKPKKDSIDELVEALDTLLGPVEELSSSDLDEVLAEARIDPVEAQRRLYEKVSEMRSELWRQNADVPSHLKSLLTQLRRLDLPTTDPVVALRAAGLWVKRLLGSRPPAQADFAFAARGRVADLSENDDDVRRELEQELTIAAKQDADK